MEGLRRNKKSLKAPPELSFIFADMSLRQVVLKKGSCLLALLIIIKSISIRVQHFSGNLPPFYTGNQPLMGSHKSQSSDCSSKRLDVVFHLLFFLVNTKY